MTSRKFNFWDRRDSLGSSSAYFVGVTKATKFQYVPLLAEKTVILSLSFPGVYRVMVAVSGYNLTYENGKVGIPPGWFTTLIYGADFFPA